MKITDSKNVTSVKKKKKASSSGKTSGVSFDAMVEAAQGAGKVEGAAAVEQASSHSGSANVSRDAVPTDAEGRGDYMLRKLEDLEKDILSGTHTDSIVKLKEALESEAVDKDQLPPRLREILDEIDMRVSIEVAKMESAIEDSSDE